MKKWMTFRYTYTVRMWNVVTLEDRKVATYSQQSITISHRSMNLREAAYNNGPSFYLTTLTSLLDQIPFARDLS